MVFTDKRSKHLNKNFLYLQSVSKMKVNDWQLMRYFFLSWVLPSMVALSFLWNFPYMGKICKNNCYKFFATISFALLLSSRFNLHVYFILFCQTTIIILPSLIRQKKWHVKSVVLILEEAMMYVTRRDVQLEHCIVPNVPISPQNHKMIRITILLRSTAPQKLKSPSSVNFVIKRFQDFTLYVNIETINTECRSDQKQKVLVWNT